MTDYEYQRRQDQEEDRAMANAKEKFFTDYHNWRSNREEDDPGDLPWRQKELGISLEDWKEDHRRREAAIEEF